MALQERPLSPFMIYRWQYTMTLSILHRAAGVYLSLCIVALVYWLAAAASGEVAYGAALQLLSGAIFKLAIFLWLLAFFYHLLNGIRHLGWDLGYGFEKAVARQTGNLVFIGAIVLTALTWWGISTHITASMTGGVV